jgi:IclR family mhp operon transcriptional activator
MELKETSRPHSTLMINGLRIGFPINMLMSAPGRAYLAFCPTEEREMVLDRMKSRDGPGHDWAQNRAFVTRILDETREQGFGARDPRWGGHITKPKSQFDDGLSAIAVAIRNSGGVLGCINIVWIRRLVSQDEMVRRHLADLMDAAKRINLKYEHSVS